MNPNFDLKNWLGSVWSPDFFEDIMMAMNNAIMQVDILIESSDKSPALVNLSSSYKH